MKRFIATFSPQAWVLDNAVDVDPQGPTTWDATAFVDQAGLRPAVEAAVAADGQWLDRDDVLWRDPAAPAWVREWAGPFEVTVEVEAGEPLTPAARQAVAAALGYPLDDEDILAHVSACDGTTAAEAGDELADLVDRFEAAGGRGVDLADRIDSLRTYLAVTDPPPDPARPVLTLAAAPAPEPVTIDGFRFGPFHGGDALMPLYVDLALRARAGDARAASVLDTFRVTVVDVAGVTVWPVASPQPQPPAVDG